MGDVYLAEHELIHRKVAIKVLHKHLVSNKEFIKRFRREAKLLASLDHHNIVRLNEYFENDGEFFLIMEYVDGIELDQYINTISGPIVETELIPLFKQMLDAIGYAHKKGLVHRDIKPANILISTDGKVKVLDFGIAKLKTDDQGLTNAGVQVGTIAYMSPEQVRAEEVDYQSDIYSLGVTLYQMAVGKAPYLNSKVFDTQLKIVKDPFPRAQEIYPGVSDKLENIIQKATQKDKKDRYQSCEEFKKDFESKNIFPPKIEKIPFKKKEVSKEKEVVKKKKVVKKKISGVNKLLFVVFLLGLILFSLAQFLPKKSENSYSEHYNKAIKYLDNKEYQFATDEFSACLRMNSETDSILAYRGLCYYELEKYEKSIKDLSLAISLNPDDANYYVMRADAYDELEKYEEAIIDYTKAIDINPSDVYSYKFRGYDYYVLAKYQDAINDFTKAISIEPDYFSFLYRGISYYDIEEYNEAWILKFKRAIDDFTTVISLKPVDERAYTYRGMAKQATGITYEIPFCSDYQKGCELGDKDACKWYEEECNTASDLKNPVVPIKKVSIPKSTTTSNKSSISAEYYIDLANDYFDKEKYKLAITNYSSALMIEPNNHYVYYRRGFANNKSGNFKDAIADYSDAIKIKPKNNYYYSRGVAKSKLKSPFCSDFKKACELGFKKACEAVKDHCEKNSNTTRVVNTNVKTAELYFRKGMVIEIETEDYSLAIKNYTKAIAIDPNYADVYFVRGMAYIEIKDFQKALNDFTDNISLNPNNAKAYKNRAICKSLVGRGDYCSDYSKACELGDAASCQTYEECN